MKGIEINEEVNYDEDDGDDYQVEIKPLKSAVNNQKSSTAKTVNTITTSNGKKSGGVGGGLFASLKSLVGAKVLTKESIEPVMEKMQEHLVGK